MMMGIGLALGTLGAILRYAIESTGDEFRLPTVGLILMIVGSIAFLSGIGLEFMKRRTAIPPVMHQPPMTGMPQQYPHAGGYPPQHPPAGAYPVQPQPPVQPPPVQPPPMQPH